MFLAVLRLAAKKFLPREPLAACLESRTVISLDSLQDKSGLCGHRSLVECQMLPKGASDSSPRVVHGYRSSVRWEAPVKVIVSTVRCEML